MRLGDNPSKGLAAGDENFVHHVLVPVYIPNHEGYYEHSFEVLKLCLESLRKTTHGRTCISVINNGSSLQVRDWLNAQHAAGAVHEVIHAGPIGKLAAVIKGLVGSACELVTIADADVLFLPGWQAQTARILHRLPKAGVVGIVPQFRMHGYLNGNLILDHLFSGKMRFMPVADRDALRHFYHSIGWGDDYNQDYLEQILGLEFGDLKVLAGSGHFVATYRREIFGDMPTRGKLKLGGTVMYPIDARPRDLGFWRVTTFENYAYHMGNVPEDWMPGLVRDMAWNADAPQTGFSTGRKPSRIYAWRDRFVTRLLRNRKIYIAFLRHFGLPATMRRNF